MTKKVVAIHGGNTFSSYEEYFESLKNSEVHLDWMKSKSHWKSTLETNLGSQYEVFLPRMPLSDNADYELWKLWFEKVLDALDDTPILVGHSLGAMFLTKYYSESIQAKKVPAVLLVAPEFFRPKEEEEKKTSFHLTSDIERLSNNVEKIVFFYSKDDAVVLFENMEKYKNVVPDAEYQVFTDKGHFLGDDFPEIVEVIKGLV